MPITCRWLSWRGRDQHRSTYVDQNNFINSVPHHTSGRNYFTPRGRVSCSVERKSVRKLEQLNPKPGPRILHSVKLYILNENLSRFQFSYTNGECISEFLKLGRISFFLPRLEKVWYGNREESKWEKLNLAGVSGISQFILDCNIVQFSETPAALYV